MRDTDYCIDNKHPYFEAIRERYGEKFAEAIELECRGSLNRYFGEHGHLPEAKAMHAEENILPIGFIYLALKERIGTAAYDLVREVMRGNCLKVKEANDREIERIGREQFFRNWEKTCRESFGEENGYRCVFHEATENEVRLEVMHCLYLEMLTEMGCPEVAKIFCDSDDFEMGDLAEVVFERKGTLAYGRDMCDFCLRKREQETAGVINTGG